MTRVETKTVRHVARLARIAIDEAALETLATEMGKILEWVGQLQKINTEEVAPMTCPGEKTLRMTSDDVHETPPQEHILQNAPAAWEGFFTVPRVLDQD